MIKRKYREYKRICAEVEGLELHSSLGQFISIKTDSNVTIPSGSFFILDNCFKKSFFGTYLELSFDSKAGISSNFEGKLLIPAEWAKKEQLKQMKPGRKISIFYNIYYTFDED